MGLFTVNFSEKDRPRIDRALDVIERLVIVLERFSGSQIVGRLEPKQNVDDIRK